MTDQPLSAKSLAEAYLYLMVTPCPNCGRGPLEGADAKPFAGDQRTGIVIDAVCRSCKHEGSLDFRVPAEQLARDAQGGETVVPRINPGAEPSSIIDVAGWLTLFRMITEAAAKTVNKPESRRLGYEAALCLEEALKFYDDEEEFPPNGAFFSDGARERYRQNMQRFAKSRLVDLRSKLPTLDAMERRLLGVKPRKKPWWRVWS